MTSEHSQEYYEEIKHRFAEERDLRLAYRPEGTAQFTFFFLMIRPRPAATPFADATILRSHHHDEVVPLGPRSAGHC